MWEWEEEFLDFFGLLVHKQWHVDRGAAFCSDERCGPFSVDSFRLAAPGGEGICLQGRMAVFSGFF